ncbi:hypothetical protein ACGFYU_08445 [Streptomyces sp. NPDC048337]|uniref:hypothetical protein n=1 Tax=Streptomyces sp. NPDC048337 TaxID=3365535 RepID=UPI003711311B
MPSARWAVPREAAAWAGVALLVPGSLALVGYAVLLAAALLDLSRRAWTQGEVVRLRTARGIRHLAVDPGGRTSITAWPVLPRHVEALREGAVVRVLRGRVLGHVYEVVVEPQPRARGINGR